MSISPALIVCDGSIPDKNWILSRKNHHKILIACDGAANHLIGDHIFPDIIIGDLDSITEQTKTIAAAHSIKLVESPDQETNDLEKALVFAKKENVSVIEIVGAMGKRIDHTLKNLSVLLQFFHQFEQIYFLDEWGIHFIAKEQVQIQAQEKTRISLIPLNGVVSGITTSGLAYSLTNEWLENGKRDGTSNHFISNFADIQKKTGDLLISVERKKDEFFSWKENQQRIELKFGLE